MYVEDNLANLNLVKRIARVGGHDIVSHTNGVDALKALETDPCHLILMDIELEGAMDGIEVIKTLRARGDERPIIAVTAYAMAGDKQRILEAGCNEYLPKPLPISQFLTFMAKYDPKNIQPQIPNVVDEDKDPTKPRNGEDKDTIEVSNAEETIPTRDMIAKTLEAKAISADTEQVKQVEPVAEAEPKKADISDDSAKRETVVTKPMKDEQRPNANP
jgi:CheY-like chemotaxis protein